MEGVNKIRRGFDEIDAEIESNLEGLCELLLRLNENESSLFNNLIRKAKNLMGTDTAQAINYVTSRIQAAAMRRVTETVGLKSQEN